MPIDPEIKALQDEIFWSKVDRARKMSQAERLATGPELFDMGIATMRGMITFEHPEMTPEQVDQEIERRLSIIRKLNERGIYQDAGVLDDES